MYIFRASPLLLLACIESTGQGPDLGACAMPPEGQYGFGEIGIGSCIAGPTDMRFVQREGRDWLAITNADPFRNFSEGSVLLIDWDDLSARIDTLPRRVDVTTLSTEAIPSEHFLGALGWVPELDQLIATRRLSPESRTRVGRDSAFLYDLSDLTERGTLQLEDDPGDVVVASDGRVFALNYTDHSISVFDSAAGGPLLPLDLAQEATLTAEPLQDMDSSGSVAELERIDVLDGTLLSDDTWTMDYLPGQFRAWVPGAAGDVNRWTTGGQDWVPNGIDGPLTFGFVGVTPSDLTSSVGTVQTTGFDIVIELLYESGNTIGRAVNLGDVDTWDLDPLPLVRGSTTPGAWDMTIGGPSRATIGETDTIFYDGSTGPGMPASIGAALLDGSGAYTPLAAPLLVPPDGLSFEQPFVQFDARTQGRRMWLSVWNGTTYDIAHSDSADGIGWSDPTVVLPGYAAPIVRYQDGRYHLWAAEWDELTGWSHVTANSFDGIEWTEPQFFLDSEVGSDARNAPRLAVHGSPSSVWRIQGTDEGPTGVAVSPGIRFLDVNHGYALSVSGGQEAHRSDLFPLGRASRGLVPTSVVRVDGDDRVFVTLLDDDGRRRIASIDRDAAGNWDVANPDIIGRNLGGNVTGVSSPLVFIEQGRYVMLYTAHSADDLTRVRAAVSEDGRVFTPVGGDLFDPETFGSWMDAEQEAHSVEVDESGVRVWIGGNDGSRWRIGAVSTATFVATEPHTATWRLDRGAFEAEVQLSPGVPGGADDSGVRHPAIVNNADGRFLYYSAFDGNEWTIARATSDGTDWIRRTEPISGSTVPAMTGLTRTFSDGGVMAPVVRAFPGGTSEVWFAGLDDRDEDTAIPQLGFGVGRGETVFPTPRMPSAGDTLSYVTRRGDEIVSVIELSQFVDTFQTRGVGTTSMVLDEDRGFLYVPSKLSDLLYVVDIRDDSREGFTDKLYDVETLVDFPTVGDNAGFRGGVVVPGQDKAVFTTRNPDGLAILDLTDVEDNATKEVTRLAFAGTLPLQTSRGDLGAETVAAVGGTEPALDGNLLYVPHFRDNSLTVFDLSLGPQGEEVGYVSDLGENPHVIALSPDRRFAVIANYSGEVSTDGLASSNLVIVDIDPQSPTWLTPLHWIVNQ